MAAPVKKLALFLGAFAVIACLVVVAGLYALRHYVQSEAFRVELENNLGDALNAATTLHPLIYADGTLRSAGLTARGQRQASFNELEIEPLRADISFGRLLEGVLKVDRIQAERVRFDLSGPRDAIRIRSATAPALPLRKAGPKRPAVDVRAASFTRGELRWEGGSLRDVAVEASRDGQDWSIRGDGGKLEHGTFPPLTVDNFRLRQHGERLTVERAELHQGSMGTVVVDGEVRFKDALELNAKIDRLSLEPLLAPDWKKRLTGNLNGTVRIASPLPATGEPELSGSLTLTEGKLEALPVLNELATFTQLAQFRTITLSRVQGDFRRREGRLSVSKLVAEASGLMRIEGAFVVENEQIKGDFLVGLAPNTLQWLPGARTKLFAATRDGYCWAPMHLEGPVGSPREDLSPRLVAAVAEGTVEGAVETLRKAGENLPMQVPDAAKKLFDLFLGK